MFWHRQRSLYVGLGSREEPSWNYVRGVLIHKVRGGKGFASIYSALLTNVRFAKSSFVAMSAPQKG